VLVTACEGRDKGGGSASESARDGEGALHSVCVQLLVRLPCEVWSRCGGSACMLMCACSCEAHDCGCMLGGMRGMCMKMLHGGMCGMRISACSCRGRACSSFMCVLTECVCRGGTSGCARHGVRYLACGPGPSLCGGGSFAPVMAEEWQWACARERRRVAAGSLSVLCGGWEAAATARWEETGSPGVSTVVSCGGRESDDVGQVSRTPQPRPLPAT